MKEYKPITPSLRHRKITLRKILTKERPLKALTVGHAKSSFRNQHGILTIRHRGGGHKYSARLLYNNILPNLGSFIVERLEYDPNRNAHIALLSSKDSININIKKQERSCIIGGKKYIYVIANKEWKPGDEIKNITQEIKKIPEGSLLNNINWKYAKAAGTSAVLINKDDDKVTIRLPSKKIIKLSTSSIAMTGIVGNIDDNKKSLGKAGANRWLGRRPIVRGEVMNAVDHPHGGKTRGGRPLKNIWGKLAKWVPTARVTK